MSLKIEGSSEQEQNTSKQIGKSLMMGGNYHSDKHVEKFMKVFKSSKELNRQKYSNVLKDPTVTGFKVFFHFDDEFGLLADEIHPNSALKYLDDIGDMDRKALLIRFIELLQDINVNHPWVFHSLEGIREVYTNPWDAISYFRKSNKLFITTFETLDYKIASLNRMWRDIYWDGNRGVMVLPENLRSFGLSLYLIDMRVFTSNFKFIRNKNTKKLANINHQLFEFGNCSFDVASGTSFFDAITNMSVNMNMNNLTIGFDVCNVSLASPTNNGTFDFTNEKDVNEFGLLTSTLSNSLTDDEKENQLKYFKYHNEKLPQSNDYFMLGGVRKYNKSQGLLKGNVYKK